MRLSLLCEKKRAAVVLIALILTTLFFGAVLSGCSKQTESAEDTQFIMDTVVIQKWMGEKAQETCDEINESLRDLEDRCSLYKEGSEISKINDAAGKEYVKVSDDIYDMLERTKSLCEESGGLFDITIAPLCLLWDITGDNPHVPSQTEIDDALIKIDYTKLLLNDDDKSVMLADEGMKIDLGGIAKGWAASEMKKIAEKNEVQGYLSLGGNVAVVGKNSNGKDISVGLRDPNGSENDYFATMNIEDYTMATSNGTERYFEQDGKTYIHILDPFTGYPVETDLLSVTVISKDGLLADALSTTIFMKGIESLDEYFSRDDCMVVAVTKDCKVYASDEVWQRLTPYNTNDYEFMQS